MSYDVFLSYCRRDAGIAKAIVEALQARGVSIWWDQMIEGGEDWRDAIVTNLEQSDTLVILFSEESNKSRQLKKELAIADFVNKDVVPVLIEDTKPRGHYLYELASRNWLEVYPDPLRKIDQLADHLVDAVMDDAPSAAASPMGTPLQGPEPDTPHDVVGRQTPAAPRVNADKLEAAAVKAKRQQGGLRDFLPFKWIDAIVLVPLLGALTYWMFDTGADELTTYPMVWSIALALFGALVFPFRYYLRRRKVIRAARMYFLSSLALFSVFAGLTYFFAGTDFSEIRRSERVEIIAIWGGIWVAFGVVAILLYAVLHFQRAVRNLRKNTTTIG